MHMTKLREIKNPINSLPGEQLVRSQTITKYFYQSTFLQHQEDGDCKPEIQSRCMKTTEEETEMSELLDLTLPINAEN